MVWKSEETNIAGTKNLNDHKVLKLEIKKASNMISRSWTNVFTIAQAK